MIIEYTGGWYRDTNISGDQVFYSPGQGCGTIWFKTVKEARKFVNEYEDISGSDLGLCEKCRNHYSSSSKEYNFFPENVCHEAIEALKKRINITSTI